MCVRVGCHCSVRLQPQPTLPRCSQHADKPHQHEVAPSREGACLLSRAAVGTAEVHLHCSRPWPGGCRLPRLRGPPCLPAGSRPGLARARHASDGRHRALLGGRESGAPSWRLALWQSQAWWTSVKELGQCLLLWGCAGVVACGSRAQAARRLSWKGTTRASAGHPHPLLRLRSGP